MIVVSCRYKRCTRCGEFKGLRAFYRHRDQGKVRLSSWCRSCKREAWRAWRRAHPERARETDRRAHQRYMAKAEKREAARERQRRHQAALRVDPFRRLADAENQRIRYRLTAEQAGREVRAGKIKNPWTGQRVTLRSLEAAIRVRTRMGLL